MIVFDYLSMFFNSSIIHFNALNTDTAYVLIANFNR